VVFDGRGLIRRVAFVGSDLIRGMAFDGRGLIRRVAFDGSDFIRGVAFDGSGPIRRGLTRGGYCITIIMIK
jgi:hypothetical protein